MVYNAQIGRRCLCVAKYIIGGGLDLLICCMHVEPTELCLVANEGKCLSPPRSVDYSVTRVHYD